MITTTTTKPSQTNPISCLEHLDIEGIPYHLVVDEGEGVARCHGYDDGMFLVEHGHVLLLGHETFRGKQKVKKFPDEGNQSQNQIKVFSIQIIMTCCAAKHSQENKLNK